MRKTTGAGAARALGMGIGVALASYAAYAAFTWARYGRVNRSRADRFTKTLDLFMPEYEIVELQGIRVGAPASVTYAAACDMELEDSPIIRTIIKTRALFLGGAAGATREHSLVAQCKELGWGVLSELPGEEIVMGAVTQPWTANPVFRALPPGEFASFQEPGYVKIVWNLRADPIGERKSIFRTETRASTTDAEARRKFRLYWSFVSPGVWLIRRLTLGPLKREAERRAAPIACRS